MTILLALWGALLSTILAVLRAVEWWTDRTHLRVEAHVRLIVGPGVPEFESELPRLFITGTNMGRKTITVQTAWITDAGTGGKVVLHPNLPKKLEHGEQVQVWAGTAQQPLARVVKGVFMSDTIGRTWRATEDVVTALQREIDESYARGAAT